VDERLIAFMWSDWQVLGSGERGALGLLWGNLRGHAVTHDGHMRSALDAVWGAVALTAGPVGTATTAPLSRYAHLDNRWTAAGLG
jgi:hypothetical protein